MSTTQLSRLVAEFGPFILSELIKRERADLELTAGRHEEPTFLEVHGARMLEGLSDTMLEQEQTADVHGRAEFIAHLAADLLGAWPGEPELHLADAVTCASTILELSEKAARKKSGNARRSNPASEFCECGPEVAALLGGAKQHENGGCGNCGKRERPK